MLDLIASNKDALNSLYLLMQNKIIKDYIPTAIEFTLINDFCELLFPLKNLTIIFSGQKYCTISILFPAIYKLIHFESNNLNLTTNQCINLKDYLSTSLQYLLDEDAFIASTFLDFRIKNF